MAKTRVHGIELALGRGSPEELEKAVARSLGLRADSIRELAVVRKSLDARKSRRAPTWVYTVDALLTESPRQAAKGVRFGPVPERQPAFAAPSADLAGTRAAVVGTGPSGLFAALALRRRGAEVTVLEQGPPLEERVAAVRDLWREGRLTPEANVQFGEGGAGTFSDGKLTTRVRDPLVRSVLATFVECGAPESILEEAHPHLGTDGVRAAVRKLRSSLEAEGVRFHFRERISRLAPMGRGFELETASGRVEADAAFIASGHSARPLFRALKAIGVPFSAKGFAVGVRAEHPQVWVDERQYGQYAGHPELPASEYFLTYRDGETGRGVYSFCMCPGGLVVNSSSEPLALVTNGMSLSHRASGFANAGIVVTVSPQDFGSDGWAGLAFQEEFERKGYELGGGDYHVPAQRVADFLDGRLGEGPLKTTFRPGARSRNLRGFFPPWIEEPLERGVRHFDKLMPGFIEKGVLLAPETRTSSPLQVVRGEDNSVRGFPGLYLVGECAGWAGGIVSSAVDALRCVEKFHP
jgi:uncharacterized protein